MRRSAVWLALVLAGCRQLLGLSEPGTANRDASDAPALSDVAAGSDAADAPAGCLGAGVWTVCAPPPPPAEIVLSTIVVDTDMASLCLSAQPAGWLANGQPEACFIYAATITVSGGATATFTGSRPVVLVAAQTMMLDGALDLSSLTNNQRVGAGANAAACSPSTSGASSPQGGAGGGGGSFGTSGGRGGDGGGGSGGTAGADGVAALLRGGCSGGDGGNANGGPALGGSGGGAIYLVAGQSIEMSGLVNVSGAGGGGGTKPKGGGGGGGSGGLIALWAPSIVLSTGAEMFANGGGGGGGGGLNGPGSDGEDPSQPLSPALGGAAFGGGGAGSGGNGAAGMQAAGAGGSGPVGAGGGGGGAGAIHVVSGQPLTGGVVSPPPS